MSSSSTSERLRPFTLVLAGGGARGFAHIGVLRALEALGYRPAALVGVSMGAVVGVTYALRPDWYQALLSMDTSTFPKPLPAADTAATGRKLRAWFARAQVVYDMVRDWGPGRYALSAGRHLLHELTQGRLLEETRLPVAVSTTDLRSGQRYVIYSGRAEEALYASSALAGVLPPLRRGNRLLADGAYADIAPVDVARGFGNPVVIAVDPGQALTPAEVHNGYQALLRAMEICHLRHADARLGLADLVLRPPFRHTIDTFDFEARRECVAAGWRVVRQHRQVLARLLQAPHGPPPRPGTTPSPPSVAAH
ncbi:patatin-like phospholipase family protein [Rhodocaloribacter litoris]|uniref:patatin-like phospholipase family protein n=1 Tax=Rhodocaloribacter litoris TaxID=2558931 RepID=UPI0014215AB9|nr:patatin-like phospholipase family protein [Rhodocaloribacter litoris]QXD14312.1 patatin-like phospholipase family protein [Rhodocaloribacter litoris]